MILLSWTTTSRLWSLLRAVRGKNEIGHSSNFNCTLLFPIYLVVCSLPSLVLCFHYLSAVPTHTPAFFPYFCSTSTIIEVGMWPLVQLLEGHLRRNLTRTASPRSSNMETKHTKTNTKKEGEEEEEKEGGGGGEQQQESVIYCSFPVMFPLFWCVQ